jgi:hypothetical protein
MNENPRHTPPSNSKMTVGQISQVYGFTIKNAELFKLLLAQMEKDPEFVGDYEDYIAAETTVAERLADAVAAGEEPDEQLLAEVAKEAEWTHDGKYYDFMEFPHHFGQGPKDTSDGQQKAHVLFPQLPEGVKMFHNPMDHANAWHLGVEVSHIECGWGSRRKKVKPMDPVALAEQHSETLRGLRERYGHALKEERPVIFEITDDCACCS